MRNVQRAGSGWVRVRLFTLLLCTAITSLIASPAWAVAIAPEQNASGSDGPLRVANVASLNALAAGGQLSFTITITNTGNSELTNLALNDRFDGLTGLQITTSIGNCSLNGTVVACNAGPLAAKAAWTVTVTGAVDVPNGTTLNNTANASAAKAPQTYSASAVTSVTVTCSAAAFPGRADLVVEGLSVHASLPDATGLRQISASFRIVNCGTNLAQASQTSVESATGTTIFATPSLRTDGVAYFGTTTTTSQTDFTVRVTADAVRQLQETVLDNNAASYRFIATGNPDRWRSLGPSAIMEPSGVLSSVGRITTIAVDPTNASIVYAGAQGAGLWKTIDAGAHWEPLTDAFPTVNVNAVAVDPADRMRLFIASPAGIFGSTDGGHVWLLMNGENLFPRATDGGALIVNGLRLYLSTNNGLRISRDGGVTWDPPVLGAGAIIQSLSQDRADFNHLLATVKSSGAGVYETFTGGVTPDSWQKLQGCPQGPLPNFTADMGIWAAQSGSTQWISMTFKYTIPLLDIEDVFFSFGDTQHELWRTTNQTCTVNGRVERVWQRLSSGSQTPCISVPRDSTWSFLYADPTDSQIVYKGGVYLCRSTDGGLNFQRVTGIHDDLHAIAFSPTTPGTVLVGNDGGLYRSTNRGASFSFNSVGMSITELLDFDRGGTAPRVIVGGSQDNGSKAGDEISPVWTRQPTDGDGDRTTIEIDPLNRAVHYSIGQDVDHFSRVENGVRDNTFDSSGLPKGCRTYNETPTLFTQFIATTSTEWHLLTTVGPPSERGPNCNGGIWGWGTRTNSQWRALFAPTNGEALTRLLHDSPSFLAAGDHGSVYIGSAPDSMFKFWAPPTPRGVTSIVRDLGKSTTSYFVSLFASSGAGRIFEISTETPFLGQDITANLPAVLVNTLAYNGSEDALYAGTQGKGIFRGRRNTSGQWTWRAYNNGMPEGAKVTRLRVNRGDGTVFAGTYGRGAFALRTSAASLVLTRGVPSLEPVETTVDVGQHVPYNFSWTVPGPGWRVLDNLQLRIRDEQGVALWMRFQEITGSPGTLSLFDPRTGGTGPAFAAGSPNRLETEAATLYLGSSSVDGPPGSRVSLTLDLSFKTLAAGRTFNIEVLAVDDSGEEQGFTVVGTLTVH